MIALEIRAAFACAMSRWSVCHSTAVAFEGVVSTCLAELLFTKLAAEPFDRHVIAFAADPDVIFLGGELFFFDLARGEVLMLVFIQHARHS